MAPSIEHRLVERARTGDISAFSRLAEHYRERVVHFIFRIVKDYHLAQDLAQDVLVRVFDGLSTLCDASRFQPWLYRIALHAGIDSIRRRPLPSGPIHDVEDGLAALHSQHAQDPPEVDEGIDDPDRSLRAIGEALAALPDETRRLIAGRYLKGLSCRQLAEESGSSIGSVKVRLHRGREKIRRLVANSVRNQAPERVSDAPRPTVSLR